MPSDDYRTAVYTNIKYNQKVDEKPYKIKTDSKTTDRPALDSRSNTGVKDKTSPHDQQRKKLQRVARLRVVERQQQQRSADATKPSIAAASGSMRPPAASPPPPQPNRPQDKIAKIERGQSRGNQRHARMSAPLHHSSGISSISARGRKIMFNNRATGKAT